MGETLLIGGALLLGGMISGLVKTHPFYRYKSQKFKDAYQAKLWEILQTKYTENEAYWISRALTDYIYDFSKRLYEDVHIERFITHAIQERKNLHNYRLETPQVLCGELVLRAIELKVPPMLFFSHMKELYEDYLVPMGKLTPKSIQSMSGASVYYLELTKLPISTKQMTQFLDTTNS
jgi:hypothetical protein